MKKKKGKNISPEENIYKKQTRKPNSNTRLYTNYSIPERDFNEQQLKQSFRDLFEFAIGRTSSTKRTLYVREIDC